MKTTTAKNSVQPKMGATSGEAGQAPAVEHGTEMPISAPLAEVALPAVPSLFGPEDFDAAVSLTPPKPEMPRFVENRNGDNLEISLEGTRGFKAVVMPAWQRQGYKAEYGGAGSLSGIEIGQAKEWCENILRESWKAFTEGPSVPKELHAFMGEYGEKHRINIVHLRDAVVRVKAAIDAKDFIALKGIIGNNHNKVSRRAFEHFTGQKLPETQAKSVEFVRGWVGAESVAAGEAAIRAHREAKEADEAERGRWDALRHAIRNLESAPFILDGQLQKGNQKAFLDSLLGDGYEVRPRSQGAGVDLVKPNPARPGGGHGYNYTSIESVNYLMAVKDGMVKDGKIVEELTPDWRDGVKKAHEFLKGIGWSKAPGSFQAEASDEQKAQAVQASGSGRVGGDLYRLAFCLTIGHTREGIAAADAERLEEHRRMVEEKRSEEERNMIQPERVPGGGYPWHKNSMDAHRAWQAIETGRLEPSRDQRMLMDSAARAIDAGLHYTKDVWEFIKKDLPEGFFSDEDLARNKNNVEHGDAGYEAYQAERAVEKLRDKALRLESVTRLSVGDTFKDIRVNHTNYSKGIIQSIDVEAGTVELLVQKRGSSNRWMYTLPGNHSVFTAKNGGAK